MNNRVDHELEHGRKLADEGAEDIWNWSSPTGQKRADRRARYFANIGKIASTDKVLEIGCGTGLFTRKVQELTGAHIVASDISEDLLSIARKELPQGKFVLEDAMEMSFPDGTFDVVFGSSILHHLDFDKVLPEIFRVLKKGGRMVFAEPNMLNPQIFIQKNIPFIKKALGDSPDETAIIRWKFAKLMRETGFSGVRIFPYDFLHPVTPKPLISFVDRVGRIVDKIPVIKEIAGSVVIYGEKDPNFHDDSVSLKRHNNEIQQNLLVWRSKHLLQEIYKCFYYKICQHIDESGQVVEIGSGIGKFKEFYPRCISTDIFQNPWIDRVENAYDLSFEDSSISSIVMIDIFHHLMFPGLALKELSRVLKIGGRIIIFEPYISVFGMLVYGFLHPEGAHIFRKICWIPENQEDPNAIYYTGQSNATRIFGAFSSFEKEISSDWNVSIKKRYSALAYVLSGGFSRPSFYSKRFLPVMQAVEKLFDLFPLLFATRVMIVLEKK